MQSETSCFTRLFTLFCLIIVMAIPLVSGCRLIDVGGDDNNTPATISTISGRVVKSVAPVAAQRGGDRPALLAADIAGAVGIVGAEVWLEDLAADPRFKTTTNASGTYLFTDVPPGEHRVIIKYTDPITGKTMKTRSAGLQVTDTPTLVEAPDLFGEPALNVVTGILRDAEGNFLPEGTVLTLWGETFTVGKDGAFTSPALPESITEAEIFVQLPGENNTTRFTAPFVSGVVPAYVELKIGADKNGNHAPTVVVSASVSGKSVSKVNPGAMVTLVAVGSDADSGDQATLVPTWSVTSGTLGDGASAFEKRWTAPNYFTVATLTVEVKDSKNATGKVQLPILVGIDNPSQVDTGRPTVALTADTETVTDSAAFNVTITFNEPVTDFEQTDISLANGSLSDFTTHTAGRIFKVKVTPQAAGEVQVSIAENVAVDLSNNNNTASNIITVTNSITPAKSSEKAITAFSFPALSVNGTINSANKTIAVTVPFDTNVSALVANFTASAKATVKVGDTPQESGTTANNFSSAVIYKVTAEDRSTAEYTVTVTVTQPIEIAAAAVTITAPVLGATPQDAAAVETATANADYTVTGLTWNEDLTAVGKFKAGQAYTATVTLTSKNSKKFQAAPFTPTVAGSASVGTTTTTGSVIGNTVSFTVSYSATGALAVTGIAVTTQPTKMSYAEATDGTLALNGMVVTETNNDSSTNTVTFTDGTATGYTANPANGAALTNATHNGQPITVTHTASTQTAHSSNLTVSAIVEISAAAVIITAPVLGAIPQNAAEVEAATNNSDYTVIGLTWNEALTAGSKFKAGQAYTATVTLTSKNGKKFQAAAFTPTVAGSASVGDTTTTGSTIGNTVSFTVTYAATGALAVTGIAVTTQPTKLSYATDDTLALNGMVVTETNNDGSTNTVTFTDGTATGYTANPANGAALTNATHNGQPITVTHTASTQTAHTSNLTVSRDYFSENIGTLKYVPAGSFQRDANAANISTVSAFRMAQHEVTRTQFSAIMGFDHSDTSWTSGDADPVQTVNWLEAVEFCNKLSDEEGLTPVYTITGRTPATGYPIYEATVSVSDWSANGYRLPTEMEWMWAAMGADQDSQPGAMSGGVNVTGYAKIFAGYNGSNSIDAYAWYSANSSSKTHPAGTKLANELGLYDMSGNTFEKCWDLFGYYPANSISDYRGAETGAFRVIRGGSCADSADNVTVAYRDGAVKAAVSGIVGFRVVRP